MNPNPTFTPNLTPNPSIRFYDHIPISPGQTARPLSLEYIQNKFNDAPPNSCYAEFISRDKGINDTHCVIGPFKINSPVRLWARWKNMEDAYPFWYLRVFTMFCSVPCPDLLPCSITTGDLLHSIIIPELHGDPSC